MKMTTRVLGFLCAFWMNVAFSQINEGILVFQDDFSSQNSVWKLNLFQTNTPAATEASYAKIEGGLLKLKGNVGCGWDYLQAVATLDFKLPDEFIVEYRANKLQYCGTFYTYIMGTNGYSIPGGYRPPPLYLIAAAGNSFGALNAAISSPDETNAALPLVTAFNFGQWYNYRIVKRHNIVRIYVDDSLQWSYDGTFFDSGFLHFCACTAGATVEIDDLKIFDISTIEMRNGLVAYYPFNGNADDVSGNGHSGIVSGATLTEDRLGNPNRAYFFRGTNSGDKITIASFPDLDNKSQASWVWWAKRTNAPPLAWHSHVLRKPYSWIVFQWADEWRTPLWFNGIPEWVAPRYGSLENLDDSQWHFYAVVFTNSSLSTYVDGVLVNPVGQMGGDLRETIRPSDYPLFIGGDEMDLGSFGGWLDDIRIYDRALSLQEINTLYRLPRPMLQIETAAVRLKWYAVSNATYEIQCSSDFQSWTNITAPIVGSGIFTNLIDWTDGGRKFYRIIRQ